MSSSDLFANLSNSFVFIDRNKNIRYQARRLLLNKFLIMIKTNKTSLRRSRIAVGERRMRKKGGCGGENETVVVSSSGKIDGPAPVQSIMKNYQMDIDA